MKMIISAGGTGGHIYPALAIIKEFQKNDKDFEVLYIGTHNRMEKDIIPKEGIEYIPIEIYGFSKSLIKRDIKNISLIRKAYKKCIKIMKEFKPDIVVGVGGYVTFPVIMAASKLKIKTVIHEQNSIPGKTNKFLSKKVDAVFTSFEMSKKYFNEKANVINTGNPAGDNVINLKPLKKEDFKLSKNKKLVLVTSGSLGSSSLNGKLIEFLKLSENNDFEVLFITGKGNYDEFIKNNKFSNNIKIVPFINNLSAIFKSCDLVISRAGATSISELLMSKTPSILIPSPNVANNHQYYNALDICREKLAIMMEEKDIDGKIIYDKVCNLLNNSDEYNTIKNNLKELEVKSGSKSIYNNIKEIVK